MQRVACSPSAKEVFMIRHKHMFRYLEKSSTGLVSFEVHLDEICDVRKFCAQLVSAKYKTSSDLCLRNLEKNDVTVRQNPVVTL